MREPLADADARIRAVDPTRSVLVQAPAGSGKTTLLVTRYLTLLERVTRPEEILALTFTRKAAAEMRERVFGSLIASDDPLAVRVRERSRQNGWNLELQPNRLRIQTIDSFAASIASALPIAAGIGQSRVVAHALPIYEEAVLSLFERIDTDDVVGSALSEFLALHDNDYDSAKRALVDMLARREQWLDRIRAAMRLEFNASGGLSRHLERGIETLYESQIDRLRALLTRAQIAELVALTSASADHLGMPHMDVTDQRLWQHAAHIFLTADDVPRRQFNVKTGFPAQGGSAKDLKARAVALTATLTEAIEPLTCMRHAPDPVVADEESAALLPIAVTLSFAALELASRFNAASTIDFTELLMAAKRALGTPNEPTDLALALDHRIAHLLIDEFQDTSPAQLELVETLIAGWSPGDGRTLFAVGDPMQSIYLFRDADVSLFQHAARRGIGDYPLETLTLSTNFRSQARLIDWCNGIFPAVFGDREDPDSGAMIYRPATPHAEPGGGDVSLRVFEPSPNRRDEAQTIATHIEHLRASNPGQSIAVLVRTRSHANTLTRSLDSHGIPWNGTEMAPLRDEPVVRDLTALFKAAWDPADRRAWFAVLRSPLVGLARADLAVIGNCDSHIGDYLQNEGFDRHLTRDGALRVCRLRDVFGALRDSRDCQPPAQWLESLWLRLGGADAYSSASALAQAERLLALIETHQPTLGAPLELDGLLSRLYAESTPVTGAVAIMTIHGAKGLEFDHVIIPGLDRSPRGTDGALVLWQPTHDALLIGSATARHRGSIYHWLARQQSSRIANERARLLYVAATRARRTLFLTAECNSVGRPSARSLLSLLWEHAPRTTALQSDLHVSTSDRPSAEQRLRSGYRWRAPVEVTSLVVDHALRVEPRAESNDHTSAAAIGTVVHRELALLGRADLPTDAAAYLAARQGRIAAALSDLGVYSDREGAIHETVEHLRRVLLDPVGRWLLSRDGESEVALKTARDGAVRTYVVDRVVSDDLGQTWVIDFKTGRPSAIGSEVEFIDEQLRNHAAQIRRYARLLTTVTGSPPKVALYLTALARLVELPALP